PGAAPPVTDGILRFDFCGTKAGDRRPRLAGGHSSRPGREVARTGRRIWRPTGVGPNQPVTLSQSR
ncbi:MAG: hypothetical protein ACKOJF_36295, partial [Planctomycetaceae bacterium]